MAKQLRPQLEAVVKRLDASLTGEYTPDAESAAKRTLKNKALQVLAATGDPGILQDLLNRSREATNMTDQAAAVAALVDSPGKIELRPNVNFFLFSPKNILHRDDECSWGLLIIQQDCGDMHHTGQLTI